MITEQETRNLKIGDIFARWRRPFNKKSYQIGFSVLVETGRYPKWNIYDMRGKFITKANNFGDDFCPFYKPKKPLGNITTHKIENGKVINIEV